MSSQFQIWLIIACVRPGPGHLDPVQGAHAGPAAPVQLPGAARSARVAQHRRRVRPRRGRRVRARTLHAVRMDQYRPVQPGHVLFLRLLRLRLSELAIDQLSINRHAYTHIRVGFPYACAQTTCSWPTSSRCATPSGSSPRR